MDRSEEQIVDLAVASVSTLGNGGPRIEGSVKQPALFGITDD
jgi:hypothetical protein